MFILAIYLSKFKNTLRDWVKWLMPLVSVLRRQKQADLCEFSNSLVTKQALGQPGLKSVNLSQNKTVTKEQRPIYQVLRVYI